MSPLTLLRTMGRRKKHMRLSAEELERIKEVKRTMWPDHWNDVPHAVAVMKLIDRFEERQLNR